MRRGRLDEPLHLRGHGELVAKLLAGELVVDAPDDLESARGRARVYQGRGVGEGRPRRPKESDRERRGAWTVECSRYRKGPRKCMRPQGSRPKGERVGGPTLTARSLRTSGSQLPSCGEAACDVDALERCARELCRSEP